MTVRMLVSRAGANFSQKRGQVVDLPAAEAERLIAAGQAEAVEPETTQVETAMLKAGKPRGRGKGKRRRSKE